VSLAFPLQEECGATYHEISLHELELTRKAFPYCIAGGASNLVVVVVEAGNVGVGELGNLSGRPADTAANVEDLHAWLDADLSGQEVLVASNGLVEGLTRRIAAEVEALSPAVLVEVRRKVVVAVREAQVSDALEEDSGSSGAAYCFVNVAYSAVRAFIAGSV
jgi:hypothetical protein